MNQIALAAPHNAKMENLRRHFTTKEKDRVIGRVKRNGYCKKHPKHRQSPGVCSLCLREKLIQLSSSNPCRRTPSIITSASSSSCSSLSSYYSSSSTSSLASPVHCCRFVASTEGKRSSSVSIFLLSGDSEILKSRSLAIVPRRRDCESGVVNKSADKSGFWFKLLHPKSKRMDLEVVQNETKLVPSMSIKIRETMP